MDTTDETVEKDKNMVESKEEPSVEVIAEEEVKNEDVDVTEADDPVKEEVAEIIETELKDIQEEDTNGEKMDCTGNEDVHEKEV